MYVETSCQGNDAKIAAVKTPGRNHRKRWVDDMSGLDHAYGEVVKGFPGHKDVRRATVSRYFFRTFGIESDFCTAFRTASADPGWQGGWMTNTSRCLISCN